MTNILKQETIVGPLSGTRVIEYGLFHAGPTCAAMLGALGAEVIKVEDPANGDPVRALVRLYGQDSTLLKYWQETAYNAARSVPVSEIVKAGGACIGSPETCLNVLQYLSDAGVDEALLFMQLYTTPHDKIMRSI